MCRFRGCGTKGEDNHTVIGYAAMNESEKVIPRLDQTYLCDKHEAMVEAARRAHSEKVLSLHAR